jgi:hypothetical protein
MANYATAVLNTAKYKVSDLMQRTEFKVKPASTLMTYLKNTEFIAPASAFEAALATKASDQQSVSVNLINKQSISTGSARAAAHTGSINDSRATTIGFTTYTSTFKYSLKGSDRNIYSVAEQVAAQIRSGAIALHEAIETAALARLNTNKSQVVVSTSPRNLTWDNTNFIAQIAGADVDRFPQYLKSFMRQQYLDGPLDGIFDEFAMAEFERIAFQGAGNSTNLNFQVGGVSAMGTQELSLDAGYDGMGYIFPVGSIGVLPWIPSLNRDGFGDTFQNGGLYDSISDPLGSGLTFALHQRAVGADNESAAGETQDVDIEVELSIDLGFFEATTSTSNLTPIFKFGIQS